MGEHAHQGLRRRGRPQGDSAVVVAAVQHAVRGIGRHDLEREGGGEDEEWKRRKAEGVGRLGRSRYTGTQSSSSSSSSVRQKIGGFILF